MSNVRVMSVRTGRIKYVSRRLAAVLVRRGGWVMDTEPPPAESPKPQPAATPDYVEMGYYDLRRLVAERGLETKSQRKDDLVRALTYGTRALTADG